MNGNKWGNEEGEITFIGRKKNSVIDYAICNVEAWDEVHSIKVGNRTESGLQKKTLEQKRETREKKKEKKLKTGQKKDANSTSRS